MRTWLITTLLLLISAAVAGCTPAIRTDRDTVFQVSTIGALMKGVYDGNMKTGELRPYGDLGIGTFQSLNGEMIVLDGKCYQAQIDGRTVVVPDDTYTPFAVVTFFDNDQVVTPAGQMNLNELQLYLDGLLPSENVFYAVKIEGKFSYMKTRSVPAQQKPYPLLTEAIKNQRITEFKDINGTVVGFRCPPYVDGVNVPGYHFHFIDSARQMGGHVLDLQTSDVKIALDTTANFVMVLPDTTGFLKVNLDKGEPEGLKQVEQGK